MLGVGGIVLKKEVWEGHKCEQWKKKIKQKWKRYSSVVLKGPVIFQEVCTSEINGEKAHTQHIHCHLLVDREIALSHPTPPAAHILQHFCFFSPCRTTDSNGNVRKRHYMYFGSALHAKSRRASGHLGLAETKDKIPPFCAGSRVHPSVGHQHLWHLCRSSSVAGVMYQPELQTCQ